MKNTIKKIIAIIFMALSFTLPVLGAGTSEADGKAGGRASEKVRIADNAGILSVDEMDEIFEKAVAVTDKYDFNIVIYTADNYISNSQTAAENAYMEFYEEYTNGIILYINMNTRDYWFATSERLEDDITESYGLAIIEDKVVPYLSDGEYGDAFLEFVELVDAFEKAAYNGHPYSRLHPYRTPVQIIFRLLIAVAIGLVVALIHLSMEKKKLNTIKSQPFAKQYVSEDGFKLTQNKDTFMFQNRTVTVIPKSSSSGGSSGSHRSSGGSSFSGRGGKF